MVILMATDGVMLMAMVILMVIFMVIFMVMLIGDGDE